MGRRKKEPRCVYREKIAAAASELFLTKGISSTSMDDIAGEAGYSKATLYAYFENKHEIISVLVLDSMKKLCECVASAVQPQMTIREKFDLICWELVRYQEDYPFYFQASLMPIDMDLERRSSFPEERETIRVGEEINVMIHELLRSGMEDGSLRPDLDIAPVSFSCWGLLGGLIYFAANKQNYIRTMGMDKKEFLKYGFDLIYRSIAGREEIV